VVRDIAREVGLEARFVDQAAASISDGPRVKRPNLLGGPLTHTVKDTFDRTLSDAERIELLDVIREVVKKQGVISEVMGTLEWKTVGDLHSTSVSIHSTDQGVGVRVFKDLSGAAALTWIGSIIAGLGPAFAILDSLQSPSDVVIFSTLGAGLAVGFGIGRTIWSITTKAIHRRTERLREEMARYLLR